MSALTNHRLAKLAERLNPPTGRFIEIDGVRLHYVEQGVGQPLVLLHGNGSMIADFASSGLADLAATRYRVIMFDRPGYGHSERPLGGVWTADAQAKLFRKAFARLGIASPLILGHSWGASVALAVALRFPQNVRGLILASGSYYPTPRLDVLMLSAPAIPLLGDVVRYAVAPVVSRVMWPHMMRRIFGPAAVPDKFTQFPMEMAVRPSQIRAEAAEAAMTIPTAMTTAPHYDQLQMPVSIFTGADDRLIDPEAQSRRLHGDVAQSTCSSVPGCGHMVHQTAPDAVMAAIDDVASRAA